MEETDKAVEADLTRVHLLTQLTEAREALERLTEFATAHKESR